MDEWVKVGVIPALSALVMIGMYIQGVRSNREAIQELKANKLDSSVHMSTVLRLEDRIKNTEAIRDLTATKVDLHAHKETVTRLDERIDGAYEEISRERHRVNGLDQRLNAVVERSK